MERKIELELMGENELRKRKREREREENSEAMGGRSVAAAGFPFRKLCSSRLKCRQSARNAHPVGQQ